MNLFRLFLANQMNPLSMYKFVLCRMILKSNDSKKFFLYYICCCCFCLYVLFFFTLVKRKLTDKTLSPKPPMPRQINLTSVKNLCKNIDQNEHLGLKNLLQDHKFVGCVNKTLALVQHLTQLYLVNTKKLSQELFYQIIIFKFGNFGYIELSEPAPIYDLVLLALNTPESGWQPEDGCKEDLARYTIDLFLSKAEMLLDYFSFEINKNGDLTAIPLLLEKYIPNWNGLPMLLLRLATEVRRITVLFV